MILWKEKINKSHFNVGHSSVPTSGIQNHHKLKKKKKKKKESSNKRNEQNKVM